MHPYHEDYVVLPTKPTIKPDSKNIERDIEYRRIYEDMSASRWSPPSWINFLLEKHAWLSAGLVWMHGASDSGTKGVLMTWPRGPRVQDNHQPLRVVGVWIALV